ncbi:MAG: membrane dipeptidase, partial [Firmicutes bacterium]|nr:membrane dipeptidase [Bacillota bacterium]
LVEAMNTGKDLRHNDLQLSFEQGSGFSPWIQTMAVFVEDSIRNADARRIVDNARQYLQEQLRRNPEIRQCSEPEDFAKTAEEGRTGVMLSLEGGTPLAGDVRSVRGLRRAGVRMMTLTWNGSNEIGGGAGAPGGLTPFGRSVVTEMEACGMAVDISHASDELFAGVAAAAEKPFVASHSNSRAVCPHRRNLTDEQFGEIVRRGGVVGINLYPEFITGGSDASLDDIYRHLEHFWSLGGEKVTAIGTDFDGAQMPSCIPDLAHLERLAEYLLGKNTKESLVEDLFFNNAYNFFAGL